MKFSNRIWSLGRVALVLSAGLAVSAQESGALSGQIRSKEGKPVAGALVRISAPQLIAPRTVTTDANGMYRAPLLPSGDYTISVSAAGYVGSEARGVRIGLGSKLVQDLTMKAIKESVQATVEVIATVAEQDKADTKTATNFSSEQLNSIPVSTREFTGAADMSPGVVAGRGGGFGVRGGTTQSTLYTLNGVSVGDDYEGRNTSTSVIEDAIEDVQVVQSPLNARFGRTGGGLLNIQSKSGGNDFSGSVRYQLTRDDYLGFRRYAEKSGIARTDSVSDRSYQIFFSGPVIKDRLWFAISSIQLPPVVSTSTITASDVPAQYRDVFDLNPGVVGSAWDHGKNYQVGQDQDYFSAKLTFALTPDHTIEYGYNNNKYTITNRNPYGVGIIPTLASSSGSQKGVDKYNTFGYKGTLSSNVFVEARYSLVVNESVFPSPLVDHVRLNMSNSGEGNGLMFPYGFNTSPSPDARNNQSGEINFKIFADAMGSHEIDTGIQFYEFVRGTSSQNGPKNHRFYVDYATDNPWANSGGASFYGSYNTDLGEASGYDIAFNPNWGAGADPYGNIIGFQVANWIESNNYGAQSGTLGFAPVYRKYYGSDGKTKNRNASIYANDQWTINNHFGVMFGIRFDQMKIYDTDGSLLRTYKAPISPRLKLTYDLAGDGARVLSFTAARYNESFSGGFTDAFVKKANTTYVTRGWSASPTSASNPLGLSWVNYATLTDPSNYNTYLNFSNAGVVNRGMQTLETPYVQEFSLGFRRNFKEGHFVSATLVQKEWKNQFAIVQDYNLTSPITVGSPDPAITSILPALAVDYTNSDALTRKYTAFELEFRNIINPTWVVGGNYTWSRLTGNTNGGDQTSQSFRDNSFSAPLYLRSWLGGTWAQYTANPANTLSVNDLAPEGALLQDQTHKARLYLTAQVPMGKGKVTFSWLAKYDSGSTYSAQKNITVGAAAYRAYLGANLPVPAGQSATFWNGLSSIPSNTAVFYSGRGAFRTNDYFDIDFKLAYELPLGVGKTALMGDIKVTNLMNHQHQLDWQRAFTTSTGDPVGSPIRVGNAATFGTDEKNYGYYQAARLFSATIGLRF